MTATVRPAIVARGGRFYGLAWLLRRYGVVILDFIERRLSLIVGLLLAVLVLLYVGARYL